MAERFFFFLAITGAFLSVAATEYFPVEAGNTWLFSYTSVTMPVVPNPLITKDSGMVKWEMCGTAQTQETFVITVKQTRSLKRRIQTRSDSTLSDSVFTPPYTKIDTISLVEYNSSLNGICFPGDTCSFAVHDPTVAMPAELSSKDTAVLFQGTAVACKKMIVSECSCLHKWYSYSFILGPTIGPVEAYISMCPGIAGGSLKETWKLTSREYPTAVLHRNARPAAFRTIIANQTSGRINCRLNLDHSSPVRIEIVDLKGRLLQIMLQARLNAGSYRYTWNIPTNTTGIAMLRVRTRAEDRCITIRTGFKERL